MAQYHVKKYDCELSSKDALRQMQESTSFLAFTEVYQPVKIAVVGLMWHDADCHKLESANEHISMRSLPGSVAQRCRRRRVVN
jgi:hypothetical protein